MMKAIFLNLLLLLTFLVNEVQVCADQDLIALKKVSLAFRKAVNKVKPSVVSIETTYQAYWVPLGSGRSAQELVDPRGFSKQKLEGEGTGLIVDKKGYIVTNFHVVDGADRITVSLDDDPYKKIEAKMVGKDPATDLALLKIGAENLVVAEFGDSDQVQVGDWAIAVGNALGYSQTVTVGIISAKGRVGLRKKEERAYEDFLQTDAAINQGNSGGPLCNIDGMVVGINSMIASNNGGSQGLGFAIPIKMVNHVVQQLIAEGKVTRGFLGILISNLDEKMAKQFGVSKTTGVLIDDVRPESPADRGGLIQGDIIIALDKRQVRSRVDVENRVPMLSPGSTVEIEVIRNGKSTLVQVQVGTMKNQREKQASLGLLVRMATKEELLRFGSESGVIVAEVLKNSPAEQANVRIGQLITQVDRQAVTSTDLFEKLISTSLSGDDKSVLLYIKVGKLGSFIVLEKGAKSP